MADTIHIAEALDKMLGGNRSVDQIAKDGARVTISQIDKLRNALVEAERCCQHLIATGRERHDDAKVWKRVARAADKLLDGMTDA